MQLPEPRTSTGLAETPPLLTWSKPDTRHSRVTRTRTAARSAGGSPEEPPAWQGMPSSCRKRGSRMLLARLSFST